MWKNEIECLLISECIHISIIFGWGQNFRFKFSVIMKIQYLKKTNIIEMINFLKLANLVEGDPKAPFSIATTPR